MFGVRMGNFACLPPEHQPPGVVEGRLEGLGEFLCERALRTLMSLVRPLVFLSATLAADIVAIGHRLRSLGCWSALDNGTHLVTGLRWLGLIRSEEAILERGTVKASDDGVHLFRIGCVDKGEALRLLRFRVADDFDIVKNKALGVQPAFDVILRNPDGEVSKKDSKAHSGCFQSPLF